MNSVRDRVERPLREQPEQIVETGTRRVALGASGPTMSTRQQADLAASQNEVLAPSPHTRTGGTDFMSGNLSRVRDRHVIAAEVAESEKPRAKTETEQAGDYYYAIYKQRQAEEEAAEQAKVTARRKREADERAAADARRQAEAARQKKAQHDFAEKAVLHECSDLLPAEQQTFWSRLVAMNCCLDVSAAAIVAEDIRASRVQED